MRRLLGVGTVAVLLVLSAGISGCSSGNPTGSAAQKTAFCNGDISIDKASANVTSDSGFLAVLRSHQNALSEMQNNLPGGSLRSEAQQLLNAAQSAISSNSTNPLNSIPNSVGGDIDTYCGVDGSGTPLPSYFATGKSGSFCTTFIPIADAVNQAMGDVNGILQALVANKSAVDQDASEVSGLPSSIESQASALMSAAQTAISTNSTAPIETGSGNFMAVSLYCGINS